MKPTPTSRATERIRTDALPFEWAAMVPLSRDWGTPTGDCECGGDCGDCGSCAGSSDYAETYGGSPAVAKSQPLESLGR
jgi:hypothetical protein